MASSWDSISWRTKREATALAEAIAREVKPGMEVTVLPVWVVSIFDPVTGRERVVRDEREWHDVRRLPVALSPLAAPQAESGEA